MPLTDTQARQAKAKDKTYRLSDERGMYLEITKAGGKYWRLKYRYSGKEKRLALGVYPEVSLKKARSRRDDARSQLQDGIDPSAHKRAVKNTQSDQAANSFEIVAREWHSKEIPTWSESHSKRVLRSLEKDLFPSLGKRPLNDISSPELLKTLRKIENRGAIETAHRVKQIAGKVFRYGISTGRSERDPSSDLIDALPKTTSKHLAAITDPTAVGKLLIAMDAYQGTPTVKTALLLSPLLLCRPGELRHMEWEEINWENLLWEIPATKMKMKLPHIVPLCKQAITLLEELQLVTGRGKYVFPSPRGASRPLSENGVRTALRTMGYDNETMTPHGFRAMGRTLLDEVLGYRIEWIECQLAHAVKDANGRAYNRTTYLKQRSEMLQKWADYLDTLKEGGNVIPVNFMEKRNG